MSCPLINFAAALESSILETWTPAATRGGGDEKRVILNGLRLSIIVGYKLAKSYMKEREERIKWASHSPPAEMGGFASASWAPTHANPGSQPGAGTQRAHSGAGSRPAG